VSTDKAIELALEYVRRAEQMDRESAKDFLCDVTGSFAFNAKSDAKLEKLFQRIQGLRLAFYLEGLTTPNGDRREKTGARK
jgi:hypothetical protein